MRRNISRWLMAATLLVGIPRLAVAQTAPFPGHQVPTVETPPGLVPQPGPAPAPFVQPGAASAASPAPTPLQAPAAFPAPVPFSAPTPFPPSYLQGDNPTPGYHIEKRYRRGMIIAGSVVAGTLYLLGAASAFSQDTDHSPAGWLYLPILGPWIGLSKLGSYDEAACHTQAASGKSCPSKSDATTSYTMLGLGQTTGAILVVAGLVFPSTELVPNAMAKNGIAVMPLYAGNIPSGLAVAGRF